MFFSTLLFRACFSIAAKVAGFTLAGTAAVAQPSTRSPVPPPSAAAPAPGPASTQGRIDLSFVPSAERRPVSFERLHGIITFRMTVQGREIWAILDNGTRSSTIDAALARELGLRDGPVLPPLRTGVGQAERHMVMDADVVIPGQVRYHTPLAAADLSAVTRGLGRPIGLVVGAELFNNLTFAIYSSRSSFEIGPSGALRVPESVPFATIGEGGVVTVMVNGRQLAMVIDLGLDNSLALSPTGWTRAGLDNLPFREGSGMDMLGNSFQTRLSSVPQVSFGPFALREVEAKRQPIAGEDHDGMIGSAFLGRFDFVMDYKTGRLWLLRPLDAPASSALTPPPPAH